MNFFDNYKTKLGGLGLILIGAGGILAHKVGLMDGLTEMAVGLITIGARSFGQKVLDTLKTVQAAK